MRGNPRMRYQHTNMPRHHHMRFGFSVLIGATILGASSSGFAEEIKIPPTHPRLLIHHEDLAALRFRCGIERYQDDPVAQARKLTFGAQRESFDRLRQAAKAIMAGRARPDDLWAPAFLHLVTGETSAADGYSECVARELLDPDRRRFEIDAIMAFDWCYDAIDPDRRLRIAGRMADRLSPIAANESPVSDLRFEDKLDSLAAAIVLYDPKPTGETLGWSTKVAPVLGAAERYFQGPFLQFCRRRGAMPTSGGKGAWEESNLVLAVELWRTGAGRSLWPQLVGSLGRSMEHYFYADTESTALQHGFIHDDGSTIPLRPGALLSGFSPAVAHAIAANTLDPVATWYAHRAFAAGDRGSLDADRYLWVPLLYGPLDQGEAARRACPLGRNFGGGWVAMRSGWQPGDTVVLFDAGQPFFRARQHFDAGQFQIYRKGRLAIDSGDDVTFEAVTTKGGRTTIGGEPGDWDEYFQATIAHNCITVIDRATVMSFYGRPWFAVGNQRLIEHDCDPSADDSSWASRCTGRLTAFETNSFYTYAAVDLSPAYSSSSVARMDRRLLFLNDGVLCVLDRVRTVRPRMPRTWYLQLPSRPELAGGDAPASKPTSRQTSGEFADLGVVKQIRGLGEQGGVWDLVQDWPWTVVTQQGGRLFVRTLLPRNSERRGDRRADGRAADTGRSQRRPHLLWRRAGRIRAPPDARRPAGRFQRRLRAQGADGARRELRCGGHVGAVRGIAGGRPRRYRVPASAFPGRCPGAAAARRSIRGTQWRRRSRPRAESPHVACRTGAQERLAGQGGDR